MKKNTHRPIRQYGGVDAATRKKARRDQLIAAGLEAFGTIGFAKSKITDICKIAGLTERYFYESFQSKKDLLSAVYRSLVEETEKNVQKIFMQEDLMPFEAVSAALQIFIGQFKSDPRRARIQLFEILSADPLMARQYRSAMHGLIGRIEKVAETIFAVDRQQLQRTILPQSIAGAIVEVARDWALEGYRIPVEDIVAQLMEILTVMGVHYKKKLTPGI